MAVILPSLETLGARGTVLAPLAMLLALSLASAALLAPALSGGALPEGVSPAWLWAFAGIAPAAAAVKAVVLSGIAWALLVLMSEEPRYRGLFSTLLYGEVILALQATFLAGLSLIVSGGALDDPRDLIATVGLDLFVPDGHPVVQALAATVTPFHVVWAVFLVLALGAVAGAGRWKSAGVVALLWLLTASTGILQTFAQA